MRGSVEVESCTGRFLNDSLFEDRLKLCNNEEPDGLKMWRNLGIRFAGTGKQAVLTTGLQTFMRRTKCEDESDIPNHALEWEKYLNQYAMHLKTDDATLRTLFLGIMPSHGGDTQLEERQVSYLARTHAIHQDEA